MIIERPRRRGYQLHAPDSPEAEALLSERGLSRADLDHAIAELARTEGIQIRTIVGINDDGVFGSRREGWRPDLPDACAEPFIPCSGSRSWSCSAACPRAAPPGSARTAPCRTDRFDAPLTPPRPRARRRSLFAGKAAKKTVRATREHAILAIDFRGPARRERIMGRAILAVFMSGLVTAACASPPVAAQVGRAGADPQWLRRSTRKALLVDDMSVDCVIASEVFDEQEFHKVGVEATAYLRIDLSARRLSGGTRNWAAKASVRHRTTWSAPGPHVGDAVVHPARPARQAGLEGRGRSRDECVRRRWSDVARYLSRRSGQHHQLIHHRRQRPARRCPVSSPGRPSGNSRSARGGDIYETAGHPASACPVRSHVMSMPEGSVGYAGRSVPDRLESRSEWRVDAMIHVAGVIFGLVACAILAIVVWPNDDAAQRHGGCHAGLLGPLQPRR